MAERLTGRNLVALLVLAALWGTAFMFISLGLPHWSPIFFAAVRFDVAGLALLAVAAWRKSPLWPRGRAQWTAIGFSAVLQIVGYHALLFWGQRNTTAGLAAVIVGLNPIITTVLSRALLHDERVGWGGVLGLALGLGGVVVLASLKPGPLFDVQGVAELAVVAAVASWALGATLTRRARHGMDVFAFTTWNTLVGALILHLLAFVFEGGGRVEWTRDAFIALFYLAIVSSSLGFLVYFTLLERIGPIRSSLVSQIAPVFAAVSGALVLGEALELRAVVAFALIAGGFALVARPAPPRSREDPRASG